MSLRESIQVSWMFAIYEVYNHHSYWKIGSFNLVPSEEYAFLSSDCPFPIERVLVNILGCAASS